MDLIHILSDVIPTAGVGGLIAMTMFYFYRKDSVDNLNRFETLARDFKDVIQENTKALTILSERLK